MGFYGRRAIGQLVYKSFSQGGRGADFYRGLKPQFFFLESFFVFVFLLEIKKSAGLRPENSPPRRFGGKVRPCSVDLLRNWSVYLSLCFEHSAWGKFLKIDSTKTKNRFFSSLKLPWEPILASFSRKMLETRFFVVLGSSQ